MSQEDFSPSSRILVEDRESGGSDLPLEGAEPARQPSDQTGLSRPQGPDQINDVLRRKGPGEFLAEGLSSCFTERYGLRIQLLLPAERSARLASGKASASSLVKRPASASEAASQSPAAPCR